MNHYPHFPHPFPTVWASDWGQDDIGFWLAFTYKGIRQAFRWVLPGSFLMGSPANEPERFSDETQHSVTLSQGFWLAETACTQALWLAVMGNNPAYFQDDVTNPVEQVSWLDVQDFITKLNTAIPQLNACLPTEAQWEYACRAATSTPFAFGDNITPEQVNYHGGYPYTGGTEGLNREEIVPVASLPPNDWGFYEMHGNVWEWCQDWYADYSTDIVTDLTGAEQRSRRVLRGGSCFNRAGLVRSAKRYRLTPDHRSLNIGFRLALGHPVEQDKYR